MYKIYCLLLLFISFSLKAQTPYGNNPQHGNHLDLNGISMYYEIYGEGPPLLLLHGNGGSSAGHAAKIEFFDDYYKVFVVDLRGHGNTTGAEGELLTYLQMSEDVNGFMEAMGIENANIWGQSDGGILGLLLAIHHPDKVGKLAVFGANISPGPDAIQEELHRWVQETLAATQDEKTKQLLSLLATQPNIEEEELKQIKSPVLVMTGDRDAIKLEHSLRIFRNIPRSNLFVMPGATHFGSYERPELFNSVLLHFFQEHFIMPNTIDKLIPQ